MVWGCFINETLGPFVQILDTLTARKYVSEILDEKGFPFLHDQEKLQTGIVWQQDNDPKHSAKETCEAFKEEGVTNIMEWPPQSPDLNPIEHVWEQMKEILYSQYPRAGNKTQLYKYVKEIWEKKIDKEF